MSVLGLLLLIMFIALLSLGVALYVVSRVPKDSTDSELVRKVRRWQEDRDKTKPRIDSSRLCSYLHTSGTRP